jgi:hypothetical protein
MNILALWSHPRARSTAMGRMFYERGDFLVKDEPFARYYYFSGDRINGRRTDVTPKPEHQFEAVLNTVLEDAGVQPVFMKDHAYHVASRVSLDFLRNFTNTFLIRDPAQSIPSLFARMPSFTLQETGYQDLVRLYQLAEELTDEPPIVISAADLVNRPYATIKAYCEAVGIPFVADALNWRRGIPDGFDAYWWGDASWHTHLARSTGFSAQREAGYASVEADSRMRHAYAECVPFYQALHERRLRIPDVSLSSS